LKVMLLLLHRLCLLGFWVGNHFSVSTNNIVD